MKEGNRKKSLLILLSATLIIGVLVFVLLLFSARTFSIYMKDSPDGYTNIDAEYEHDGILKLDSAVKEGNRWVVTFRAVKPGRTAVTVLFSHAKVNETAMVDKQYTTLYVTKFGTILRDGDLDFNGFYILCFGLAAIFGFYGVYLFLQYRRRKKIDFFSYNTVLDLGLSLFFLLHALVFSGLIFMSLFYPDMSTGRVLLFAAQYALTALMVFLLPLVLLLAAAMAISNVWLVRHEGVRRTNLLAFLLSGLLLGGIGASIVLAFFNTQVFAFEPSSIWISLGRTIVSTVFLYFAAILFATQYCCVIASFRRPPLEQDYILILGCAIRKDGTLYPLIKGRADRAIAFYHKQKEATGHAPVLLPSGGQGGDECMAEAEAVRRYLLEQGIPASDILAETQSANTLQNMQFSKALIDEQKPDAHVLFSTTNYHVFRSGILANDAGLHADGIASKTKWYFWPNAQIREFVGLLVRSWKLHAVLLTALLAFSVLLSNLGNIISLFMR